MIKRLVQYRNSLSCSSIDQGNEPTSELLELKLKELGTWSTSHNRFRSLFEHLRGTASILQAWNSPKHVVRAGYFHSIYSTDSFSTAILSTTDRGLLQGVVGTRAERLVYLFSQLDRRTFLDAVECLGESTKAIEIVGRPPELIKLHIDREEAIDLLALYAANLSDQSLTFTTDPAQIWLSSLFQLDKLRKELAPESGLFSSETVRSPSASDEAEFACDYARDLAKATRTIANYVHPSIENLLGEVWVWRAVWSVWDGDIDDSIRFASRARQQFQRYGFVWDKRILLCEWDRIASVIQKTTHVERSRLLRYRDYIISPQTLCELLSYDVSYPHKLTESLTPSRCEGEESAITGFKSPSVTNYLCGILTHPTSRMPVNFPSLRRQISWNASEFPLAEALENNVEEISNELFAIDSTSFHDEPEKIDRSGSWEVMMLYERGRKVYENCMKCPTAVRLIERYQTVNTLAGLIYVSKLKPKTRIAKHQGPTNLRLRCHLAIKVPSGDCGIRVNGETLNWSTGKCLVFDDSFEHEAWNNSDSERIVLIVDLWHPDLTQSERSFLTSFHAYISAQSENLQNYWRANENKRYRRHANYD
jgi:aspartyl/asparaginyl beta-hydroxylase (cupin superfamily)